MFNPISTYRIQFNRHFSLADLERIIPYLQNLGVNTLYASPIFQAIPGSVHGYDVLNPLAINPEIGTEKEFRRIAAKLKEAGINWLQDIVPNHMAYHPKNVWLADVLEKGQQSAYASFFDITWNSKFFKGRLMAPFLGNSLEEVIKQGELKLVFKEDGRIAFNYFDSSYPLHIRSYQIILQTAEPNDAIKTLLIEIDDLHKIEDKKSWQEGWNEILLQFQSLMQNELVRTSLQTAINNINNDPQKMMELADEQVYRLCHWQETDHQINYRRFFTVNGLICLNMQDEAVFNEHHQLVKQFINEGLIDGVRVDHIDGLYNPTEYLQRLRKAAGEETYIVVEKILEPGEDLPGQWPVQGTTGYDFLSQAGNLLTNKKSGEALTEYYRELTSDYTTIQHQLHEKKMYILEQHMAGELENLFQFFLQLNIADKKQLARIPPGDLQSVIGEFLVQCPVYRFYGSHFPLQQVEEEALRNILLHLKKTSEFTAAASILENIFLHVPHEGNQELNDRIAQFYQRCMQFTGPLMAKGVEDTLMYTYNRFIGHNEVGDSPETFGIEPEEFHRKMIDRQQHWPMSMNASSTHDTKRGEDARARLNVLTDLHEEWIRKAEEWRELNKDLKQDGYPDANDEYLLYQSLTANYPMPGEDEDDFSERVLSFITKALREAKVHSNWTSPNEQYESAATGFAATLLDKHRPFWKSFEAFQQQIADHGIINSLTQVVLKFTCPGVPDVYQGTELWDFSFVDPDNRRPVDFEKTRKLLQSFEAIEPQLLFEQLWQHRYGGSIKLWLVHQLLQLRSSRQELFAEGDYIPLHTEGSYKAHVLAFARKYKGRICLVAVPLHTALLCREQQKEFFQLDWLDTKIILPKELQTELENSFLKTKMQPVKNMMVKDLFQQLPVAVLKGRQTSNERGAGILVHLTSLPSSFGIGDMGPTAKSFVDFLYQSNQKYWQLLPLNPTEAGQGHSPYSALSTMAGNPLLISPELLLKDGLLTATDLAPHYLPQENKVNFATASSTKQQLFEKAFTVFLHDATSPLQKQFKEFCHKEAAWLDDFSLFMLLKKEQEGRPWYEWPTEYKKRNEDALKKLSAAHRKEIKKIKWLQFIFAKQWHELRLYCNHRHIQLIGDLPFYVSYDSSDAWSHREIFALDENGNRTGIAGVPPDAFSADGQLWGMPVFNWEVLKSTGYKWWINRLRKNMELFDLVRLDHFRAFADYWEVAPGEETAKNGQWKPGPGSHFFHVIEKELGGLPFVAEDLGDINEKVLNLRDEFHLSGMKVLQFAFGEDMPQSDYVPHNYRQNFLVYPGTHDNNTTIGWYRTEADDDMKKRIDQYTGTTASPENIHHLFARLAYGSVAQIAILPIQDVLGLDESARMNTPSSTQNNWMWRLLPGQIESHATKLLLEMTKIYNRE